MTAHVPEHAYAKWSSDRERKVAGELGFRVHRGMVEFVSYHDDEITAVRPATATEEGMWSLLVSR